MSDIYGRLGLRPLINARGSHTRLGGSIMPAEVLDAMREAAQTYIVLEELQEKASEVIARATGAEAGMVTGGAAAGLILGTAACIAGSDPASIERLPDTSGMKGDVVMHRAHRNGYDHSVRAAGARIVEAGYGHGTIPYQLEAAIGEQTALVFYVMAPWASKGALSLRKTCEIAHRKGVPVMVDAAAMLPPAENLTRIIADGADLVVYSGGKGIRGPQSSGILAGRADLVRAAAMNGSPNHSIGRPAKAAREDIVGLIVALERFMALDHDAELARCRAQAEFMLGKLGDFPGVEAHYRHDGYEHPMPRVELVIDRAETGIEAGELIGALEQGDPRVFVIAWNGPTASPNNITINTHTMLPGEEDAVAEVIGHALRQRLNANAPALAGSVASL
ncbi:MAG TPA: aminotransferase class V-fold PLP-dependent enzyme [Thermomicrobiales bacterium]|nr:aminotransferase class V-fold PLP-dependent enzyme [Thermomicrobiales bacterium]